MELGKSRLAILLKRLLLFISSFFSAEFKKEKNMRIARILLIPIFLFTLLGCDLSTGVHQTQSAPSPLPTTLTSIPTVMGAVGTMATGQIASGTAAPGTLGITLSSVELLMGGPGAVYTFSQGVSGGQPDTVAKLIGNDPSVSQAMVSDF